MTEEKKPVKETIVVAQLPQQPIKEATTEDGKAYTLVTVEEALTEILLNIRAIKSSLA